MTAPTYRLYLVDRVAPPRPGLVRSADDAGQPIAGDVWTLTYDAFGRLTAGIRPPLCMGSVTLADGSVVTGFLGEAARLGGCRDITEFGGWRGYLWARQPAGADCAMRCAGQRGRLARTATMKLSGKLDCGCLRPTLFALQVRGQKPRIDLSSWSSTQRRRTAASSPLLCAGRAAPRPAARRHLVAAIPGNGHTSPSRRR